MKNKIKGVILAGGSGTRLRPATFVQNKHLLNILNEPIILYPLRTLISLGITDILLISGGNHLGGFIEFLNDGYEYGVNITYKAQREAGGIAQAVGLAEDFAGNDSVTVILADNIFGDITQAFVGGAFDRPLSDDKAAILVKEVPDASRFGVLFGDGFRGENAYKIIEKPKNITKGKAVTGLYVYPPSVFDVIKTLKPSARGELEITEINNHYLQNRKCRIYDLPHNVYWHDAGTPESLAEVTKWAIENRQKNEKK